MMINPNRRAGFTLIEMLVVIWALAITVMLGTAVLVGAFKVRQAAVAAVNHLSERAALADQFRLDVGGATAVPDSAGDVAAGPACLLLRRPDGKHVVYRWTKGRLERSELPGGAARWVQVGAEGTGVEFVRPGADRRVVTLRLTPPPQSHGFRPLEISAALGGDLR